MDLIKRAARYVHHMFALRKFGEDKRRILFVLGHMRTGSSLLVHILNSNPAILGYGETLIGYHHRRSLIDLEENIRQKFREHGESAPRTRYIMDKVLHGRYIQNIAILQDRAVRAIVLVRCPEEALPSILSLGRSHHMPEEARSLCNTPEKAFSYYVERLGQLEKLISQLEDRVLFTTYEGLVERTEKVLSEATQFLELRSPLTPEYEKIWATGQAGIGDSSSRIEEGAITRRSKKQHEVVIPKAKMQKAKKVYTKFCASYPIV